MAAGDALYISRDGVIWLRVDLPASASAAPGAAEAPGTGEHAGHQHGQPAPANPITTTAVGSSEIFVGTPQGLFMTSFAGPLHQIQFPGGGVRGLAMDPAGHLLWATSAAGPLMSTDAGRTWSFATAGLDHPGDASAIAHLGRDVFVTDGTGVFRWHAASETWVRTSSAQSITVLDPDPANGALYASSESRDLQVFTDGRWTNLGLPAAVHVHHGHVHGQPATVTSAEGRLYAAGTPDGVSASADDGWTWTQLGGGLGATTPNQVIGYRGGLLAASDGLYSFPLTAGAGASPAWWAMVLVLAIGLGIVAVGVGALDPRRRRRRGDG